MEPRLHQLDLKHGRTVVLDLNKVCSCEDILEGTEVTLTNGLEYLLTIDQFTFCKLWEVS